MTLNQSSIPKPDIGRKLRFCPCRNIAITFWIEKLEWCGCPTVKEFLKTEYTNVTDRRTDIHRTTAQAALTHSIARIKNDDRPMWKYCRWHENQKLDVNTSHKFYCSTFDVNVCSETQSPLTSTWPHLRSDVGSEEGNIEKKTVFVLHYIVYYYNGAQTYEKFLQVGRLYRAFDLAWFSSVFQAPLCLRSSWRYIDNIFLLTVHPSLYLLVSWAWWDWLLTWLTSHHPSVLWHCWLDHLTHKIVSEMTYNVSSGTLNPIIPYQNSA